MEMFSDARVVAPVIQTAEIHSRANPDSTYLYVFTHPTRRGYYPQTFGSVHGEEIPYFLGMPLVGGTYHMKHSYLDEEKVLAEITMNYLYNFALTG